MNTPAIDEGSAPNGDTPPRLLAPGVRLFRNLRFRAKAMLISAAFLVPTLVMAVGYFSSLQEQISIARKERLGVAALGDFVPMFHGMLDVRNATRAGLGGFDAKQNYLKARQRVDDAIVRFESHLPADDPLQLKPRLLAVKQAWTATASSPNGVDDKGRTVFGPMTEASLALLRGISDDSNLVLDPDLDSLYLVNALVLTMPRTAEDLGQVWGWGTYAVAKGGLDNPEQYRRMAVWNARAAGGIDEARDYFARAASANPDLQAAIDLSGLGRAADFVKGADPTVMIKAALEAQEAFAAGEKALAAYMGVYDRALPALDGLLAARIGRLEADRNFRGLVALVSLGAAAYLLVSFSVVMGDSLRRFSQHLRAMADGDLRQAVRVHGRDEAAKMLVTLDEMQDSLRRIVTEVRGSVDNIVQASHEIAAGSTELSTRTERASADLQQTASTVETIETQVDAATQTTQRAAEMAGSNARAADRGGRTIADAVESMEGIHAASARIGDIIGTIDGIAFHTNILALNAAVEAARAGEQGRGFAVVASEVRSLAQRSATAAREIKVLIGDTVSRVDSGSDVVRRAGDAMQEIVGSANQIHQLLGEVSELSTQQSAGMKQVGSAVNGLDSLTQQNAALSEQTAAACEAMQQRALELASAVARFQLPG